MRSSPQLDSGLRAESSPRREAEQAAVCAITAYGRTARSESSRRRIIGALGWMGRACAQYWIALARYFLIVALFSISFGLSAEIACITFGRSAPPAKYEERHSG